MNTGRRGFLKTAIAGGLAAPTSGAQTPESGSPENRRNSRRYPCANAVSAHILRTPACHACFSPRQHRHGKHQPRRPRPIARLGNLQPLGKRPVAGIRVRVRLGAGRQAQAGLTCARGSHLAAVRRLQRPWVEKRTGAQPPRSRDVHGRVPDGRDRIPRCTVAGECFARSIQPFHSARCRGVRSARRDLALSCAQSRESIGPRSDRVVHRKSDRCNRARCGAPSDRRAPRERIPRSPSISKAC